MMGDVKGGFSDVRNILGGEYGRKSVAIVEFRGFFYHRRPVGYELVNAKWRREDDGMEHYTRGEIEKVLRGKVQSHSYRISH